MGRENDRTDPTDGKLPDIQEDPGLFAEFWDFLKHEKKWWLLPLVFVLVALGLLLIFAQTSPLAPFIYPLF